MEYKDNILPVYVFTLIHVLVSDVNAYQGVFNLAFGVQAFYQLHSSKRC